MNGAQKRTKHIWKGLRGKKYRYLTVAILCVSLIMAASMLMLSIWAGRRTSGAINPKAMKCWSRIPRISTRSSGGRMALFAT